MNLICSVSFNAFDGDESSQILDVTSQVGDTVESYPNSARLPDLMGPPLLHENT